MSIFNKILVSLISFVIFGFIYMIYSVGFSSMTTREIIHAERICNLSGYKNIKNLDMGRGYKQVYTVHCVVGDSFVDYREVGK